MLCPRCQSELKEIVYEGVVIDTCEKCEGEWLDNNEILIINKARDTVFSDDEKEKIEAVREAVFKEIKQPEKPIYCPRCKAPLKVRNYAYSTGIIVDLCLKCYGLWLDKDELEHVQIIIEEYEKKMPELEAKLLPVLAKIREEQDIKRKSHIDEIVAERPKLIKSRILNPLIKSILYRLF